MAQSRSDRSVARWFDRHPLLVPLLAAAGFLGLFQSAFLLWRTESMAGGLEMALGMARFGLIVGLVTVLLLVPVVLLVRRLLPAWRRGQIDRASWSASFVVVAALAGWILADRWATGPWVPEALEAWIEGAVALACAFAAFWVQPPLRWQRFGAAATPLALALSFLPIGEGPPKPEPLDVTGTPRAGRPDVVLVSIDTLRADRLGVYGRSPSLTPQMDRLASEGVLFERALASSPWTVPSVASMLTGQPTVRHAAGWPLGSGPTLQRSPLDDNLTTLAERFAAAGYRTRAVVANGFLSPFSGFGQGFHDFANPFFTAMFVAFMRELPLTRAIVALTPIAAWGDYRAQGVTDQALAWLAEDGEEPLFLWLHYIDPHSPFQADPATLDPASLIEMADQRQPEVLDDGTVIGDFFVATDLVRSGALWLGPRDRERLASYYDRAVSYTDEHIGRLFDTLRERSIERPLVAAVTADHGEEFWDHGYFEHGHDYYREITRIPLLFWGPDLLPAGRAVSELVGLVDVGPTLLELAGLEPPQPDAADEGRSIAPLWRAAAGPEEPRSIPPRFSEGNLYNLPAILVEDGPWRFILRANDRTELYDTRRDPEDHHNVAPEFPEIAERYRQLAEPRLRTLLEADRDEPPQELSPQELRALKALGYVD